METGFEAIENIELCREWATIMENTTTVDDLTASIRFLRVCQELDKRRLSPYKLAAALIASTAKTSIIDTEY